MARPAVLTLKGAFSPNPRLEPLLDGTVRIPGVEITWQSGSPGDLHLLHLTKNPCDVFEFSISNYIITRDQPEERERLRWMAMPIFLSKAFMWLRFYVHVNSGIKTLADLRGKRVGGPDYHMTAAIWMRIMLKELYGIRAQDIEWFNGRPPGVSHGTNIGEHLAPGISLTRATYAGELEDKLNRGDLHAAYGMTGFTATSTARPLFGPGDATRVVGEYRRKTGMTPTNHVLVVQQELVESYPEIAGELYRAVEASKREAYKRAERAAPGYLLFAEDVFAEQAELFGEDPFPSGLAANRTMLETVAHALFQEGLISHVPEIDGLFCPALRST